MTGVAIILPAVAVTLIQENGMIGLHILRLIMTYRVLLLQLQDRESAIDTTNVIIGLFKGELGSDKGDKSEHVDLEVTREKRCILLDLLLQEMRSWNEEIIKEWSESYHVTMCPADSRVQRFKPADEVYAQHQLLKLVRLFRKASESVR